MSEIVLGVQTFTYRKFSPVEMVQAAAEVGLQAIELWPKHIGLDSGEDEVAAFRRALSDHGVQVCGMGVCGLEQLGENMEAMFSLAASFGARYISVNLARDGRDIAQRAIELAQRHGLVLGIHNHGPKANFSTAEDVLDLCGEMDETLGACADFGHYMRSDQMPAEVIRKLGRRINSVHLKDFISEEEEVIPGTGRLDFAEVCSLLQSESAYAGEYVIEYEADPDNPNPAMKQTVDVLRQALAAA